MQSFSPELARRARTPGYLVMALLIVSPLIELCTSAWPFHVHEPAWRLSFAGTAGALLGWPILGLFLTFVLAAAAADTVALLLVTGISILAGVSCILQAMVFALDALEMKGRIKPELAQRYGFVSAWWLIKLCAAGTILLVLAVSAMRAARRVRHERKAAAHKSASLLVGPSAASPRVATPPSLPVTEEAGSPL